LATSAFSGGNQQKIVLARELDRNPELLLIGQPTRGVDIGAIEFIHRRLVALRDQGKGILLVSVELDEILALADRILVMHAGRIVGEVAAERATESAIGLMMGGAGRPELGAPLPPVGGGGGGGVAGGVDYGAPCPVGSAWPSCPPSTSRSRSSSPPWSSSSWARARSGRSGSSPPAPSATARRSATRSTTRPTSSSRA